MQMNVLRKFHTWEVEMTTVSRSQVATTRNAGDGLAVGRQVFRSYLVQTFEHLDADSEPNPVDNVQNRRICLSRYMSKHCVLIFLLMLVVGCTEGYDRLRSYSWHPAIMY